MNDFSVNPNQYVTDDMALATTLMLSGHTCQGLTWRNDSVFWVFATGKALLDLADRYLAGEALVDPLDFVTEQSRVRRDLFKFKDARRAAS